MQGKREVQESIEEIIDNIKTAEKYDLSLLLVEANHEQGYDYPYILCYPNKNMERTMVMDCLNDYEDDMKSNEIENQNAVNQIYSLFGENRIISNSEVDRTGKIEENEDKSLDRMSERIKKATNRVPFLLSSFENAPVIIPLIPGFKHAETHENVKSELGAGVAKELAPQITAMLESAGEIIEERTGIKLEDKILSYGHSKESTFADAYATLNPEKVKGLIVGGTQYATLPLEEVRFIVDNARKNNEEIEIRNGIPYKKITQEELDEIRQEYNENKKVHQRDIELNDDGSYSLPLNYPVGIADIEQYTGNQDKEKYIQSFRGIPRIIFNGEDEEREDGHYVYTTGKTLEGNEIKEGEDLALYEKQRPLFEIENASMHNRVLDYIAANRVLFGRGANEKLKKYMDLCAKLELDIQSKLYKNYAHVDILGSGDVRGDLGKSYKELSKNNIFPQLGDNGRAERMSPVHQLKRRYLVSNSLKEEQAKKAKIASFMRRNKANDRGTEHENTIGAMQKVVDEYIAKKYDLSDPSLNMDSIYDSLTIDEISNVFDKLLLLDKEQAEPTDNLKVSRKNNAKTHLINKNNETKSLGTKKGLEDVEKSDVTRSWFDKATAYVKEKYRELKDKFIGKDEKSKDEGNDR